VEEAWKLAAGDPSLTVAIVDQGIKYSHPDLAANMWINKAEQSGTTGRDDDGNGYADDVYGYNFALGTSRLTWDVEAYDDKGKNIGDSGHGTHVAGTVAAVNNNGKGVCGVAGGTGSNDGVKLMSCQIFSGGNGGTISTSVRAIKYAADNGASIIQCSWGYPTQSPFTSDSFYERNYAAEKEAIDYFVSKKNNDVLDGGLAIFAAGNDATNLSGRLPQLRFGHLVRPGLPAGLLHELRSRLQRRGSGRRRQHLARRNQRRAGAFDTAFRAARRTRHRRSRLRLHAGHLDGLPPRIGRRCAGTLLRAGQRQALHGGRVQIDAPDRRKRHRLLYHRRHQKRHGTRNYRKNMGTGSIDAYQLLMQIEGTPCLPAKVGVQQVLSLDKFFGQASANLTYKSAEMSQADMDKLGITAAPAFSYGKLQIKCTKPGVAKIKIKAMAGSSSANGEMSGMEITKEFAIIARAVQAGNGGWL